MPVKTALLVLGGLALLAASAPAHGIDDNPVLVVDTDAGLDDLVALAMTLQHARVKLAAIVVTEGACGRERGVGYVERLVDRFNRRDVALYAGTDGSSRPPPPFRASAERLVGKVLPDPVPPFHRAFAPGAYGVARRKATVLVLGPLTSLAAALRAEPGLRDGIAEILVAGPAGGFNLSRDPEALETVRKSGLPIELVAPGPAAAKPTAWREAAPKLGRGTSVGEAFLAQLLADAEVRRHYVEKLPVLYDELAFLFYVDAAPFARTDGNGVFAPRDRKAVRARFAELITRGRQRNTRVVLADRALPDGMLRPDVRARREAILRKNGEEEWFSVLLLNEVHEHLGAYSVIGVKMGLRAAEILNAPRHAMRVVSRIPPGPPASCAEDGLIIGTGSTPGRGLFRREPPDGDGVRATFTYGRRSITLELREEYRARIRAGIRGLLEEHTLEDDAYWTGVRRLGLDIWENWNRLELFRVEAGK